MLTAAVHAALALRDLPAAGGDSNGAFSAGSAKWSIVGSSQIQDSKLGIGLSHFRLPHMIAPSENAQPCAETLAGIGTSTSSSVWSSKKVHIC
jgi:hypothetical protein